MKDYTTKIREDLLKDVYFLTYRLFLGIYKDLDVYIQ